MICCACGRKVNSTNSKKIQKINVGNPRGGHPCCYNQIGILLKTAILSVGRTEGEAEGEDDGKGGGLGFRGLCLWMALVTLEKCVFKQK